MMIGQLGWERIDLIRLFNAYSYSFVLVSSLLFRCCIVVMWIVGTESYFGIFRDNSCMF